MILLLSASFYCLINNFIVWYMILLLDKFSLLSFASLNMRVLYRFGIYLFFFVCNNCHVFVCILFSIKIPFIIHYTITYKQKLNWNNFGKNLGTSEHVQAKWVYFTDGQTSIEQFRYVKHYCCISSTAAVARAWWYRCCSLRDDSIRSYPW